MRNVIRITQPATTAQKLIKAKFLIYIVFKIKNILIKKKG
jgi:hypothetical protein